MAEDTDVARSADNPADSAADETGNSALRRRFSRRRAQPVHAPQLLSADIVPDSALELAEDDRFDHTAIAGRIAELATEAVPPINIALFGPWGSGKTSFFRLIAAEIQRTGASITCVRYDAWKYGGSSLKKNFITSLANELDIDDDQFKHGLYQENQTAQLDWRFLLAKNVRPLLTILAVAALVSLLWTIITATIGSFAGSSTWFDAFKDQLPDSLRTLGTFAAAIFIGVKVLDLGKITIKRSAPSADEEFFTTFSNLIEVAKIRKNKQRLLIFVDELDRCDSEDVVSTLVSLKTFLDQQDCIFIVAADRAVLELALGKGVPQETPVREREPYYSTVGSFIDKIFQHQIALPPLRQTTLTKYARDLVVNRAGIWGELREAKPRGELLDEVVYTLVPAHIRSPRRVKVLLNNFATNARIAQSRGINLHERASEIAKLSVLQTEFPSVASDLLIEPRLLEYLLSPPATPTEALDSLLKRYRIDEPDNDAPADDSAAGRLVSGEDSDESQERVKVLQIRLNQQLERYLKRVQAAAIPDPQTDLLYLQITGLAEGISEVELGKAIDAAADSDPDEIIAKFEDCSPADAAISIRLLTERSAGEFGPGRENLVECACRLAENLPMEDLDSIALTAAPHISEVVQGSRIRSSLLPGAIRIAALGKDISLTNHLVSRVVEKDDPQLAARLLPALPKIGTSQANAIYSIFGNSYDTAPEFLHDALANLPQDQAENLWNSQKQRIAKSLKDAAAAPTGTTSSEQESETDSPNSAVEITYKNLLDSIDHGDGLTPHILVDTLTLGTRMKLEVLDNQVFSRVVLLADQIDDRVAITELALLAISYDRHGNRIRWGDYLITESGDPQPDSMAAIESILMDFKTLESEKISDLNDLLRKISAHATVRDDREYLASLFDKALQACDWASNDALLRRHAIYEAASTLRAELSTKDLDIALAEDISGRAVSAKLDDADVDCILGLVENFSSETALLTLEKIDAAAAPNPNQIRAVRVRIAMLLTCDSSSRPSIPSADDLVQILNETSEKQLQRSIVGEWLKLCPEIEEALTVMRNVGPPQPSTLGEFAQLLTNTSRTALWLALVNMSASAPHLRAAAKPGVEPRVVTELHSQAVESGSIEQREKAVAFLLTLPYSEQTDLKRPAIDICHKLLETGKGNDVAPAVRLIIAMNGAPSGQKVRTRELIKTALNQTNAKLNSDMKRALREFGLLAPEPKPKRRGFAKILDIFDPPEDEA